MTISMNIIIGQQDLVRDNKVRNGIIIKFNVRSLSREGVGTATLTGLSLEMETKSQTYI